MFFQDSLLIHIECLVPPLMHEILLTISLETENTAVQPFGFSVDSFRCSCLEDFARSPCWNIRPTHLSYSCASNIHATVEELFFLLVHGKGLQAGQSVELSSYSRVPEC